MVEILRLVNLVRPINLIIYNNQPKFKFPAKINFIEILSDVVDSVRMVNLVYSNFPPKFKFKFKIQGNTFKTGQYCKTGPSNQTGQ